MIEQLEAQVYKRMQKLEEEPQSETCNRKNKTHFFPKLKINLSKRNSPTMTADPTTQLSNT